MLSCRWDTPCREAYDELFFTLYFATQYLDKKEGVVVESEQHRIEAQQKLRLEAKQKFVLKLQEDSVRLQKERQLKAASQGAEPVASIPAARSSSMKVYSRIITTSNQPRLAVKSVAAKKPFVPRQKIIVKVKSQQELVKACCCCNHFVS